MTAELPVTYLTEEEAATYLRRKKSWLQGERLAGRGPRYRKHGALTLYTIRDLDAWSDAQARGGVQDADARESA